MGTLVGLGMGTEVGFGAGTEVGAGTGTAVGLGTGTDVGLGTGTLVGKGMGALVGARTGCCVGAGLGGPPPAPTERIRWFPWSTTNTTVSSKLSASWYGALNPAFVPVPSPNEADPEPASVDTAPDATAICLIAWLKVSET